MNKEKLQILADAIRGADNSNSSKFGFDMDVFYHNRSKTEHPCGTAACIAGWAAHLGMMDKSKHDNESNFAEAMDIPLETASLLCIPEVLSCITQEHAADVIEHFIETNDVDYYGVAVENNYNDYVALYEEIIGDPNE